MRNKYRVEGDIVYISCKGDKTEYEVEIDIEDLPTVDSFKGTWCVIRGYCSILHYNPETRETKRIQMHRLLMEFPEGLQVDHIDRRGWNNRRSNLRVVSDQENKYNRGIQRNNTSGYKGVSYSKRDNVWRAYIQVKGKQIRLGQYEDAVSAALARNKYVIENNLPDSYLNKIEGK